MPMLVPRRGPRGGPHVLRLCSVFEPEAADVDGRSVRFDPVGGMQTHTAALSRCLGALGIRQTVLTARLAASPGVSRLAGRGTVRRLGVGLPWLRQLWALAALPHVLAAPRPVDLVHAHQGEDVATLLLALVARVVHRCPLVVTLHCSVRHTVTGRSLKARVLRLLGGAVEQSALRRPSAVITLVPHTATLVREDGIPADRVHVLPSGFDPGLFTGPRRDVF